MKDERKTKKQLVTELAEMRQRVAELEVSEAERKQAKEALRRERDLFINGPVVVVKWKNSEHRPIEYISLNISDQFGYSVENLMSGRIQYVELIHPDDRDRILEEVRGFTESGAAFYEQEYRIARTDGIYRWVHDFTRVIRNAQRVVTHYHGYIHDITERKRAEEALRESEERFRSVVEFTSDAIINVDSSGTIIYWNKAAAKIFGYSPDKVIGRPLRILVPERVREMFRVGLERMISTEKSEPFGGTLEVVGLGKGGNEFPIEMTYSAWESKEGLVFTAIARDITERKRAEEALRESEERFRGIIENALFGYYRVGKDGLWQYVSPEWERMHGYSHQEIVGKHFDVTQPEKAKEQARENVRRVLSGETMTGEFGRHRKDGSIEYHSFNIQPVYQHGAIVAIEGFINDITERKRAEEALQQRNRELAMLNRAGQTLVSILDLDQVLASVLEEVRGLLDATASSVWLTDLETDELVCQQTTDPQYEIVRGWRLAPGQGLANWVTRSGKSLIVPDAQADERYCEKVGQLTGLDLRSILTIPLRIKDGVIGALQVVDTKVDCFNATDVELLEPLATSAAIAIENARLYEQAQRDAETKSMLLREVNHRVKNNLTSILGMIYAARNRIEVQDRAARQAAVNDLIGRVQGLAAVSDILSASEWAPLRLSDLAARVIRACAKALPPGRRVSVEVFPSPICVTPDEAHNLALVISELATNSFKYALEGAAALPFDREGRDTVRITFQVTRDDSTIYCEFRDDGPGYPADVLQLERYNVGFALIQKIVRNSLHGELALRNDRGAVTSVQFRAKMETDTMPLRASPGMKMSCSARSPTAAGWARSPE